jgi:hypothetical protein
MIRFTAPAALGGLVLLIGPLLIHLLQRRQARRRIVPTVRFVPRVAHSSLRPRNPEDIWLLLLRMAVIAAAVLALAGPIVVTARRQAAWDARTVRAVVLDTSPSVASGGGEELARGEVESAAAAVQIASDRIGEGLRRAANWFDTAPPGRREVVVLSDFQQGSLDLADMRRVPGNIGLRFVRMGVPPARTSMTAGSEMYAGAVYERTLTVDGPSTALTLTRGAAAAPTIRIQGASPDLAAWLERIVRQAGAAFPAPAPEIVLRFGEVTREPAVSGRGRADAAALRLLQDETLEGVRFSVTTEQDVLVVTTDVAPASFEAVALVHAALSAWRDPEAHAEAEPLAIPDDVLQRWTRETAPADPSAWRHVDRTDARWFWILALVGLCAEWAIKRRGAPAVKEGHAQAA